MPRTIAEPNQEEEIKAKTMCLPYHVLGQQPAGPNTVPMIKVIDEPVIVTRPLRHSRPVLWSYISVLAGCHCCNGLPFLSKRNSTGGITNWKQSISTRSRTASEDQG